jgi:hypothetical protein
MLVSLFARLFVSCYVSSLVSIELQIISSSFVIHSPARPFYFPRRYILLMMLLFGSLVSYTQRMSVPLSLNEWVREGLLAPDEKGGMLAGMFASKR